MTWMPPRWPAAPFGRFFVSHTMIDDEDDRAADTEQADVTDTQSQPEAETEEVEAEGETETDEEADAGDSEGDKDEEGDDDSAKSEEADTGEGEEPAPKRASRNQRYQRRIERLERENSELRSRAPARQSDDDIAREVERQVGKKPDEKDFNGDYLAFERALTVYEVDKRAVERDVKNQGVRQQAVAAERHRALVEAHQERVDEFREKAKDFDQVLKSASNLKAAPAVEGLVLDSDKSAHLVYYLAKNPNRLNALNGMSERDAAREIGRIEARLSLPQPKKQTQAPKPVTSPRGGAAPSSPDKDLDTWLKSTYG